MMQQAAASEATRSATRLPVPPRGFIGVFTALLLTVLIAGANVAAWAWFNPPLELPDWHGKVRGVAYSGFQRDQDPTKGRYPSSAEIEADMARVAEVAERLRTYSATENRDVPRLAAAHGLKVTLGAWLDKRSDNNDIEVAAAVRGAKENANVDSIIVGNESVLRGDLTVPELITYVNRVKRFSPVKVSSAEPWHVWMRHPELTRTVDFITVHLLPYWEGVPVEHALDYALERYDELKRTFPGKPIVIGEIGWPSQGDRVGGAVASPGAQAYFLRDLLRRTAERPLEYYVMEMFDQPWKYSAEGRAGAYWGMFHADRTPKWPLAGPVSADPAWQWKALGAMLLAAPFILWFALRFRHIKLAGVIAFAALIQTAAAALVWLATIPLEFYLRPIDWIALAVLLPGAAAMLAVLLAQGFEFVEVLWHRYWQRAFRPQPEAAADPAHQPFVSIHLPACNEPPEMVILTLDSLARLDYENFEVLVVDNNTKDERLWKPVQAHCEKLGPKFRFFHLPQWPGFKAGALNFALRETDPRAEAIGVVDADYAVEPNWLRDLVGHFADANVAVVQAPQAHRDFERHAFRRMANWEFDGFFRVGMHHRNERNAIIQHGTMTLVRKSALAAVGGWAEWCICEDAELGLRLMEAGHDVRYVDEVLGRGLTPADFKAFKTQRFRWAFGAMQILKRHWKSLTGASSLSTGQRFHFLTGWFSWFADALHLVFAFGALAWTIATIAAPWWFPLPLYLYFIPIGAFLVTKAIFGPVLYRARVDCSWADVIGASLASMALSHAIARGVFEGLWRKSGEFKRTAKGAGAKSRFQWLGAIREEAGMLVALLLAVGGVVLHFGTDHVEAMLWAAVLAAQSLPYAATVATAWISAQNAEKPAAAGEKAAKRGPVVAMEPAPQRAPVLESGLSPVAAVRAA